MVPNAFVYRWGNFGMLQFWMGKLEADPTLEAKALRGR